MDGEVILNDTYAVTVRAGDLVWGLSPGDVQWRVDANPWRDMQAGASDWTADWFTTDYADGTHTLAFRATDAAGHVVTHSVRVTVDNNDPTVSLNTPSVGEYVDGVYTFSARAADSLGVRSVVMSFGFSGPAPLTSADATYNPSTGYWELTVDTTTLPDGPASVSLTATDASGRQTVTVVYDFAVDNNAPELLLVSPSPGEIVLDDTLSVLVNASDVGFDLAVGDVEYNLDGTGWVAMENVTGEATLWGFDMNATTLADGEHDLMFRVTDAAGHVTTGSVTFTVDLTDPTAAVVSPVTGEFAMGVYVFRVAAVDSLGISEVKLTFGGIPSLTEAMATYNPASGMWEFLIDTRTLDDTQADVFAVATDSSGRMSVTAGPVDFVIDNNAPVVAFVDPMEGDILTEGQHTVTVTAIDSFFDVEYGMVSLSVDDGSWQVMAKDDDEFSFDWNTSGLSDGEHNLKVMAEDEAGHVMDASINVIVDNNVPSLAIVSPTDGQFVTGSITFQVASSDARGIRTVLLSWVEDGSVFATVNTATNYYEFGLDTTTLEDGTYTLTAIATDGSGLVTEATVEFHVDNTEPELEFEGPLSGAILDGEVVVSATATDTFIDTLQFSVDGVGWVDMVDGTGTFNSTGFADGDHTITVRAIDGSGKEVSAESRVTIDNNDPLLSVADFPAMGEHLAGERLFAVFSDDVVGVEAVTVTVDGEEMPVYLNPATGFYEWTLKTADHTDEDGILEMTFTSVDAAGHDTSIDWEVFVDNTPPVITDQSPKDGDTVREIVRFEATVVDNTSIDAVLLRIGHGPWITMDLQSDGTYLYKWETTTEDDQEDLEYIIRVTDTLGNTEDATYTIDVDNPMSMTWIALAIILIVLALVVFFMFRRKAMEEGETESVEDLEEISTDEYDALISPDDLADEVAVELDERELS
jgi:methionine-rich copper-binding protein CopC